MATRWAVGLGDPLGPRLTLLISLLTWVNTPSGAFLAAAVLGLGNSIALPAFDSLLAALVVQERRSGAFSVRHATMNGRMALGALLGSLVVDTARPGTYQAVFVIDASAALVVVPLLLLIPASARRSDGHRRGRRIRLSGCAQGQAVSVGDRPYRRYRHPHVRAV